MEQPTSTSATYKILIAEDDPIIRNNLYRTLSFEGYHVFAAEDGQQALDLALQHLPDLIISDLMMPVMDGQALLKAIRDEAAIATTPFVFLTARAERADIREGMKLGAEDYLSKPFLRDELLEVVATQLKKQALRCAEKQQLQQEKALLRKFDYVTELPNRQGFEEALHTLLSRISPGRGNLAVVIITLNNLHLLRQSHGARCYEQVLRAYTSRLHRFNNTGPFSGKLVEQARVCDGSFAIVLCSVQREDAENLVRKLLDVFIQAVIVENESHFFQASAGIALYPDHGQDALTLIQNAEAAEPPANTSGSLAFYCAEANARLCRRMRMTQLLNTALANNELYLSYQPQLRASDKKVIGFEALLRWQNSELGFVSPAEFIPIAEMTGLIVPIGAWVVQQACKQLKVWHQQGFTWLRMAVNLSAKQFESSDLYPIICEAIQQAGIPSESLELEITESIAMQNQEQVQHIMQQLAAYQIKLAMDDFGTGYSSLTYLKGYPLHSLKIDQAFVRHFLNDEGDEAIIKTIIALANSFKLSVIAEGVETREQAEKLLTLGCQYFQGYLYGKPMMKEDATQWLLQHNEHANAAV